MKCLIAVSDASIARSLELFLSAEGFKAFSVGEGEEAVDLAKIYDYDLALVADALDDISGLEFVRRVRAAKITTPILVLARDAAAASEARALDAGADDYLRMPFHRDVLVSRAQALIRRSKGHAATIIEVGPLAVDLGSKQLLVDGKPIHLTGSEYGIVEALALRKGLVLSKEMLLNQLYGGMDEPEIKIIDVFICKIRNKLRPRGLDRYLETSWGRGYRLVDSPEEQAPMAEVAPRPQGPVQEAVFKALAAGERPFLFIRGNIGWAAEQTVRNALSTLIDRGAVEKLGSTKSASYRLRTVAA